jgi:hypothetical protein
MPRPNSGHARFWFLALSLAGAAALLGGANPSHGEPATPLDATDTTPPVLLAQALGGFPGSGASGFLPGGGAQLAQGGRQGGFLPGGFSSGVGGGAGAARLASIAPGGTLQLAALCTDLLSDPPDATTHFDVAKGTQVASADGAVLSLNDALQTGLLGIRGRRDTFDPIRRDGSLALDLYVVNLTRQPVRVALQAGSTLTPQGQTEQTLPAGAERLPLEAARQGITSLNTLQFAVWGARGSTTEEVEQANMFRLPQAEVDRVQDLLDACGISKAFDRQRGVAEKRYADAEKKLGEDAEEVSGSAYLTSGYKASISGYRNGSGVGVVTVHPLRYGGDFRYGAKFQDQKDGRTLVKLFYLANGRPAHANRGELMMTSS